MPETPAATRITQVTTVGIPVADQDRALAFYTEKLGFEKRLDVPLGQGDRWLEVAPPGSTAGIALLRAQSGKVGIDTQIRLATEYAEATLAELRARGVDADDAVTPYPVPMFSFRDIDGNRFRLVERPKGR